MNDDLLTVTELSKMVDKSRQSIYKQLSTSLQPYVVKVDNKTMLKKSVLTEYFKMDLSADIDNMSKPESKSETTDLSLVLDVLKGQLEVKDEHIKNLTNELIKINDKLIKLQENSQTLQLKMIENENKSTEEIEEKEIYPQVEEVKFAKNEKKGFLSRIFHV